MTASGPTAAPDATRAPLVAIAGAAGFIGRHLVRALAESGWRVRVLLQRDPDLAEWQGLHLEVVPGSLDDAAMLERLVEDATAVIHVGGHIKAATRHALFRVHRDGAAQLAAVTQQYAPQAHFILLSCLAAREPALSHYAASRHAGEVAVREQLGVRATILRAPAVYGPGDRRTLLLFQLARRRVVPLPGSAVTARVALIQVSDLARLVVLLAGSAPHGATLSAADARPHGYGWDEVLASAARALGNPAPRSVRMPVALLKTIALAGDLGRLFGAATVFNSQTLRELQHPDWAVSPAELASVTGWAPEFDLDTGLADAVAGYRAAGRLPR